MLGACDLVFGDTTRHYFFTMSFMVGSKYATVLLKLASCL
jgi:hypothetical protein